MKRSTTVNFMTFLGMSPYIKSKYAVAIKVSADAAMENPAPSQCNHLCRMGGIDANTRTMEVKARYLRYLIPVGASRKWLVVIPTAHFMVARRPPHAPNQPLEELTNGALNVIIPVPIHHQSNKTTLQTFSTRCPSLPLLGGTKFHSKNPGIKNSKVCKIRQIPKLTHATLRAYFIHTLWTMSPSAFRYLVSSQRATTAKSRTRLDNST
mmetsp:Transcript_11443/g.22969  ORF Transcript_11443/g.22969 Transcript_11443/m.22969 type:complete len:209 (+) Transcript_11443:362-988(+)